MRALVTGGAGFIGSFLVEGLLSKGWQVIVIDDLSTGSLANLARAKETAQPDQLIIHESSLFARGLLEECIVHADHVYHMAAAVGVKNIVERPLASLQCNVQGTELVLELTSKHKKKTYIASTSEVYGKLDQIPFKEDAGSLIGASSKLRWSYAAGKLIDEFLAIAYFREQKHEVIIGRHFNTVGPRQASAYGMVIPKFIEQALGHKPLTIFGDGQQTRTFTHVAEAARIVLDLMETPQAVGQVFNIGGAEEISIKDLASRIKALTDSPSPLQIIPFNEVYNEDFEDMPRRVPDCAKLEATLGYKPTMTLDNILQDAIAFAKEGRI